jgi:hypothetical protein
MTTGVSALRAGNLSGGLILSFVRMVAERWSADRQKVQDKTLVEGKNGFGGGAAGLPAHASWLQSW